MDQLTPILVVAGVAIQDDRVLLTRRPKGSHLEGLWEFPGGKVDGPETPEEGLRREWREELGVEIRNVQAWTFAYHSYPEKTVLILFYNLEVDGDPMPREGQAMAWVSRTELPSRSMPAADAEIVAQLLQHR